MVLVSCNNCGKTEWNIYYDIKRGPKTSKCNVSNHGITIGFFWVLRVSSKFVLVSINFHDLPCLILFSSPVFLTRLITVLRNYPDGSPVFYQQFPEMFVFIGTLIISFRKENKLFEMIFEKLGLTVNKICFKLILIHICFYCKYWTPFLHLKGGGVHVIVLWPQSKYFPWATFSQNKLSTAPPLKCFCLDAPAVS